MGNQYRWGCISMKRLDEILQRCEAAKLESVYRTFYPPEEYNGDEWDLGRSGRYKDFKTHSEAAAFALEKHNKRVPDWGQPHVQFIEKKPPEFCSELTLVTQALMKAVQALHISLGRSKTAKNVWINIHVEETLAEIEKILGVGE